MSIVVKLVENKTFMARQLYIHVVDSIAEPTTVARFMVSWVRTYVGLLCRLINSAIPKTLMIYSVHMPLLETMMNKLW